MKIDDPRKSALERIKVLEERNSHLSTIAAGSLASKALADTVIENEKIIEELINITKN
jgi:hypothetical protein